jgi:hypothetical protein
VGERRRRGDERGRDSRRNKRGGGRGSCSDGSILALLLFLAEEALDVGDEVRGAVAFPQLGELPVGGQDLAAAQVAVATAGPGVVFGVCV